MSAIGRNRTETNACLRPKADIKQLAYRAKFLLALIQRWR